MTGVAQGRRWQVSEMATGGFLKLREATPFNGDSRGSPVSSYARENRCIPTVVPCGSARTRVAGSGGVRTGKDAGDHVVLKTNQIS